MRLFTKFFIIWTVFLICGPAYAGDWHKNKNITNLELAQKYAGYAADYERRAAEYENKASGLSGEAGDKYRKLAANFRSCAQQKRKMAEAYRTGNKQLLEQAQIEYNRLTKAREGMSGKGKDYWDKNKDKSGKASQSDKIKNSYTDELKKRIKQLEQENADLRKNKQ